MSKRKRLLAVFDMDSTIAQTFIEQSLFHSVPQSEIMHFAKLPVPWPHKLKMAMQKYPTKGASVHLRLQHIKPVHGIKAVFQHLHENGAQLVVLSGANDHMCWEYLKYHNLEGFFSRVIANKMIYFQHQDRYELQLPQVRKCKVPMCGQAPCKKHELTSFTHGKHYDHIYFVGDGTNDLCGMSAVGPNGRCFVRRDYELHDKIKKDPQLLKHFHKPPEYWHDGVDLLQLMKQF